MSTANHSKPILELRSVTCHMRSHSAAYHPTQGNTPHLNPSQAGWYSINLPRRDGRLSGTECYTYKTSPVAKLLTYEQLLQFYQHYSSQQHHVPLIFMIGLQRGGENQGRKIGSKNQRCRTKFWRSSATQTVSRSSCSRTVNLHIINLLPKK